MKAAPGLLRTLRNFCPLDSANRDKSIPVIYGFKYDPALSARVRSGLSGQRHTEEKPNAPGFSRQFFIVRYLELQPPFSKLFCVLKRKELGGRHARSKP
jgi:hypothetical protein